MIFLISMALALLLVLLCGKAIKKYPLPFYIAAAAVAAAVPIATWTNPYMPPFVSEWIWPIFARGGAAGAFFVIVMTAGAFPNGSAPIKRLMPIRGQLSIIASILTFGHNIAYGKTYFVRLFTAPDTLPVSQCAAAVCSLLMLLIMIPLFVTSLPFMRKKMNGKSWKKLQRSAYAFYALLCTHILLLTVPGAVTGRGGYRLTVFVYGTIFSGYAVCRVLKSIAVRKKNAGPLVRRQITAILLCMAAALIFVLCLNTGNKESDTSHDIDKESETSPLPNTPSDDSMQAEHLSENSQNGVFHGSGMGMNGKITVSVTLNDGKIVDIVIDSQQDDEPYFTDAVEIIEDMISQNSTDVDTISGATYSSGGIIDAVADALKNAEQSYERNGG